MYFNCFLIVYREAAGMSEKKEIAYNFIKERIIYGELPPMADVSEKDFQLQLGISRTPVHEALARLEDEGFVQTYPRKGTFVTPITREQVSAVYEVRLLNEPYMTRRAVTCASRAWLESMHRRMIEAKGGSPEQDYLLMTLDGELHAGIVAAYPNPFLRAALRSIYDHDQRIRFSTKVNPPQIHESRLEHIRLLELMLAGDAAAVEQLSREHILHSRDLTYGSLGLLPDTEVIALTSIPAALHT